MFITPANIVIDASWEQHIFLKYHGNLVTKYFQIVVAYIHASHLDITLCDIIESGDPLHQGRLCTSGSADDTYCLTGFNMKIYILQGKISSLSCIAEIYMIKVNGTICHILYCISFILHLRNFIQNLYNTVCGCFCYHDHNKHESYHVQGHENLKCVDNDTCQLTGFHATENNTSSANCNNDNDYSIHGKHHNRWVPCNDFLCFSKQIINISGNSMEFLNLIVLSYESLNYTWGIYILLNGIVQVVIFIKDLDEMRMCLFRNKD